MLLPLPWPCLGLWSGFAMSLHDRSSRHTASVPYPFSPGRHNDSLPPLLIDPLHLANTLIKSPSIKAS